MIGRELGRGMTGRVYVAQDVMLARPVAIKFVANLDAHARQQFLLEARAVAQIHHPNVVGIYRIGTLQNRPYFVTELVRGESLAKRAKPIPWQDALDIAIGLARGLAAAHRRNVVHCDLKPSNVMVEPDGVAKIIDFGLARIAADGSLSGRSPVGTPDYMAPEVWRGESPSRRADVYSLGAVLYEMLAGTPPFGDVEPKALPHVVPTSDAPALRDRAPDVDAAFADVVMRCLRRDAGERFADGDELREALERLHFSRRHTVAPGANPYRGLLPFEADHRGVFFGRRSEVDAVIGRLRGEPIVLVTGDSGVGKSSLCRAGVVPAVIDGELGETWQALTMVPDRRPLTALATALGDPGLVPRLRETPALLARELRRHAGDRGLIVFVDQFEEVITLGDPGEVAALDAGLAGLLDGVPGLRLLATARADFLARISTLPGLGRDLPRLLYFLRPLPPERLRDVIVGPAAAVGTRFESDAIVDDLISATAAAGSGGLPLLSFALADLWEARDRATDVISSAAVTAMGGVTGALSRHADVVVREMLPADRAHARRMLLRLVTALGTRARRGAHELVVSESARAALDALVKGRLVVVHDEEPGALYELAHECLLTGWPTLRQWLEADTAGRETHERLTAAATEWVRLGRRGDATWHGRRLEEAFALDPASLSPVELAFIAASRRAIRRRRWLRWLAALLVVMLVALAYATQRYVAQRERDAAVAAEVKLAIDKRVDGHAIEATRDKLAQRAFAAFDERRSNAGEDVWRLALAFGESAARDYVEARGHIEIALAKDPTRSDLRGLLGDILIDLATLAERVHDIRQRDEVIRTLALYDPDDSRRARWNAASPVVIRAPDKAAIVLSSEIAPSTAPVRHTGSGPRFEVSLAPGAYLAEVALPGRVPVRAPILVERGVPLDLDIALPPRAGEMPAGFLYIPEGEFLYGSASEDDRVSFFWTTPLRHRWTPAYLIGRTEVTIGDYLRFVETLKGKERAARIPGVPMKLSGSVAIIPDGAHWRIELQPEQERYTAGWDQLFTYPGRLSYAKQDWRRFPVTGVSVDDAKAYAAWLDRTGQVRGARVCSEVEWERAARGADGRPYPGGATIEPEDANLDATHGPGQMGPDEVGSHPGSTSPFGLLDMVGNAFEMTLSETGSYIIRGGSYGHDRKTAHLTNRGQMNMVRDVTVGFRLCATPPLPR